MKKITGILVNPTDGTVKKATLAKSLDSYYTALGCSCVDIVSRRIGKHRVEIICDDEGLLTDNPRPSATDATRRPGLFGSLFLCDFAHQSAVRFVKCNLSNLAGVEVNQARCMAWDVVTYAATIRLRGAAARTSHQR